MSKLTKTLIDRMAAERTCEEKPYFIWCSDMRGFGIRMFPSGKRVFYADYRTGDGKRRRMKIGPMGVLTVEEARVEAGKLLKGAVAGDDPLEEKRTRRKSLTLSQLCDQYFEEAEAGRVLGRKGQPKKASTLAQDKGMAERHIKPLLGAKLVIDLRQPDVVRFIKDVQSGKTKTAKVEKSGKLRGRIRVSGGNASATRAAATLGTILTYAVGEGIIPANPVMGVKKPAVGRRERRLAPDEYRTMEKAFHQAEIDGKPWQGIAMLRFAALSGFRIGEVENLTWAEVDFDNDVVRLDDSKTGKSIRPLGHPAATVLSGLERDEANPYVFPAARLEKRPYAGIKRFYWELFKAAELEGVTPHVLRHSFASVGADLGFTDSTIGACLGHAGSGITSRYTHRLDSVLIAAANKIAVEIECQMRGTKAGKLLQMPKQA